MNGCCSIRDKRGVLLNFRAFIVIQAILLYLEADLQAQLQD